MDDPRRRLACAILAALLLAAVSPPYSVRLDARRCAALPARNVTALEPAWLAVARYVQRCPVRGPGGQVALFVDIVRLDRALDDGFFDKHPYSEVAPPIVRDATGRIVGHLPEGFPIEPPGRLKVRFTRWRGNRPEAIALYEAGESALAPHPLPPLRWDARSRTYR